MPDRDAPTTPTNPAAVIDWNIKGATKPAMPPHVERDVLFASAANFVEEPRAQAGEVPDMRGDLVIPEADLGPGSAVWPLNPKSA